MNILVFDTETSGLPRKDLAYDHPEQARIVQLACVVLDERFKEVAAFHSLIKPSGWTIHPKAQDAHGISMEQCEKHGISMDDAYAMFTHLFMLSDRQIAHNLKFDLSLLDIEYQIHKDLFDWKQHNINGSGFCTMEAMTPVCKLPKKFPNGNPYKWPKLVEAYKHCFGKEFDNQHDAMSDVKATAAVYKWLVDNNFA